MTKYDFDPRPIIHQLKSTDARKARLLLKRIGDLCDAIILTTVPLDRSLLIDALDVLTLRLSTVLRKQTFPSNLGIEYTCITHESFVALVDDVQDVVDEQRRLEDEDTSWATTPSFIPIYKKVIGDKTDEKAY